MRINPNDFYVIEVNGEIVIPDCFDFVMDYWTAEAVQVFIQAINPKLEVTIQEAYLTDLDEPIGGGEDD